MVLDCYQEDLKISDAEIRQQHRVKPREQEGGGSDSKGFLRPGHCIQIDF